MNPHLLRRWLGDHPRSAALAFWASLALALALLVVLYRQPLPLQQGCIAQIHDVARASLVALPLARTARGPGETLLLQHRFAWRLQALQRPALYIGEATPYFDLQVNARHLTPNVDLDAAPRRDLAPHLYALPPDILSAGDNLLSLRVPVARSLSETRVGMLCIGDYDVLLSLYKAEWWRRVGLPKACLCLFLVMAGVVFALRRIHANAPLYRCYLLCIALMSCRSVYLVVGDMPGGPANWRVVSDVSIILLIYAMYRLIAALWNIRLRHWSVAWLLAASLLQLTALWSNWTLEFPLANLLLWLSVAGTAGLVLAHSRASAPHVPALEKHCLRWAMLFAVACGALEAVTYRLDAGWRLIWLYPLGTALLAVTLGFLLTRRAILGATLLMHARQSLGRDLDQTLLHCAEQADAVWQTLSSRVAGRERERVLLDIDAGFGARMAEVVQQLRRELPHSRLQVDIQRALLDLRLMIDAMELELASLAAAFAILQQRLQPALFAAGIAAQWEVAVTQGRRIEDRRRLMELFRCMEELLSNVIQHSAAAHVWIDARSDGEWLQIRVADDGCGMRDGQPRGRGLDNVRARLARMGGSVDCRSRPQFDGTCIALSLRRL
ncbi:sensor histidine kinase [Tahibacter aquaticus]|uniref:sensor histidine kinase n=1 Tax=Tahibacter aquaticus TaxID=520092 RepID=UPI001414D9A4|nr:ATP-binding protein [Tahibacter aquaticus]